MTKNKNTIIVFSSLILTAKFVVTYGQIMLYAAQASNKYLTGLGQQKICGSQRLHMICRDLLPQLNELFILWASNKYHAAHWARNRSLAAKGCT